MGFGFNKKVNSEFENIRRELRLMDEQLERIKTKGKGAVPPMLNPLKPPENRVLVRGSSYSKDEYDILSKHGHFGVCWISFIAGAGITNLVLIIAYAFWG